MFFFILKIICRGIIIVQVIGTINWTIANDSKTCINIITRYLTRHENMMAIKL